MNSGAVGINRNIISSRIRITGGLGNGGKTWDAFLTLALQDIVEDRLMRHGSVWVIKFLRVCGKRGYHYSLGWQMKTWAIPTA